MIINALSECARQWPCLFIIGHKLQISECQSTNTISPRDKEKQKDGKLQEIKQRSKSR